MKKLCKRGLCLILIFSLVNIHSPILEASTTGKTEISYDGIVVENNSNVNDYIQFKNLNYINEEDKTTNCTITLYKDKEKLSKLKSSTIGYTNFRGKDYSWNIGNILGKEAGSVYLTFKYTSKEESEVIKLDYEEEKTSSPLDMSNVVIENKYNGTSEKIYVTVNNLSNGDYIYVYKQGTNGSYTKLGSLLCRSKGTVTGNYTRTTGLDKLYLTQKKKNQYESIEKQEVIVPEAGVTDFGKADSDYPDVKIVAKDQTGNDVVEISGVGTSTVVTLYTDASKTKKIKSQTINTKGSISITNILSYGTVYVTLRAPDKYESAVIPITPVLAEKTQILDGNVILENNSGTNDYIKFTNLKYTEDDFKNTNVTFTLYADKDKKEKLYSGTISYSYLQGNKTYSVSIGKKLKENSGTAYLSYKYPTQTESELIPILYEEEKYSPIINEEDVLIVNKYTGTSEKLYVTLNKLCSGDIVYAYKLLANGSYSQLASATCSATSDSVTLGFANPAGVDCIYLQVKRPNQYDSKQKTKINIPKAGITSYGSQNTDLPDLSIKAIDKTGNDLLEISGAQSNTKFEVYSDENKTNKITSATINTSGSISIKNIMNYEALYVTVRVPDKYECAPIRIVPVPAPKSKIAYKKIYVNNYIADVGDSLCFEELQYAEQEDNKSNLTLKIFADQDKSTVLYSGTVSYSKLQGENYSVSLSNKLGLEPGTLYVSVKYPTKRESDLIPVSYEGEKTSPKLGESQVVIDNDLIWEDISKCKVKVRVPKKAADDIVKVYLNAETTDVKVNDNEVFELPVGTESIFVTIQNKGCYESERTEVKLPTARSCTTLNGKVEIENNAGIYSDWISYTEDKAIPEGTVFSVYQYQTTEDNTKEYVKIGSTIIENNRARIEFPNNRVLGEEKGTLYTTLKYPGYAESSFSGTSYEEESIFMRVGVIEEDANTVGKLTILNTQKGDVIYVYDSEEKNSILAQVVSDGNSTEIYVPSVEVGDTIYITNKAIDREESEALAYTIGNMTELGEIAMDKDFVNTTYGLKADFSTCSQILIGLVRVSGRSAIRFDVFDENGKKINEKLIGWRDENSRVNYKRWITIDNPREDSQVHLYNIRVNQVKYENDTSYRLVTGNAQNSRELLGGKENSVDVEPYKDFYSESTKKGGNLILGEYIPGEIGKGYFYHFKYVGQTITLCTRKANLRFCIYNENKKIQYDSKRDDYAQRIEWMGGFSCVQKAKGSLKKKLEIGKDYFVEVYSVGSIDDFEEDYYSYHLAIGDPILNSRIDTFYAGKTLSIPEKGFSNVLAFNLQDGSVPDTALVKRITPKDNSGKRPHELVAITKFRVRNFTESYNVWHTCTGFYNSCEFTMSVNSPVSTHLKGRWEIEAYSEDAITITPGFEVEFYYEIGD